MRLRGCTITSEHSQVVYPTSNQNLVSWHMFMFVMLFFVLIVMRVTCDINNVYKGVNVRLYSVLIVIYMYVIHVV